MRIKKRTLYKVLIFLAVILIASILVKYFNRDSYQFKVDKFQYLNRGKAQYDIHLINKSQGTDIYSVIYMSRPFLTYPVKIFGLLFIPSGKKNIPGIVLLPGGGVPKEAESTLANYLADNGYAVLTIDQRGIGETGGYYLGIEEDYNVFLKGKEPIQHLSVYDILRAYDVLKDIKGIDKENIAVAGESMGGRYAIIAAAIEKRFKGAMIISSAGFHINKENKPENNYLLSIDPDHYIADISPRPLFMLHGSKDTKVRVDDAKLTFSIAKDPKKFFIAEGCGHGYCEEMNETIIEGFKEIFK